MKYSCKIIAITAILGMTSLSAPGMASAHGDDYGYGYGYYHPYYHGHDGYWHHHYGYYHDGYGIAAGIAIGALLGYVIGDAVHRHDTYTRTTVVVAQPQPAHRYPRRTCLQTREYQTRILVGGRFVDAYGTACLKPDGSWTHGPATVAPAY